MKNEKERSFLFGKLYRTDNYYETVVLLAPMLKYKIGVDNNCNTYISFQLCMVKGIDEKGGINEVVSYKNINAHPNITQGSLPLTTTNLHHKINEEIGLNLR